MYLCFLPFLFSKYIKKGFLKMSLLEIEGLTHSFGENLLYKNAGFTLNRGEHIGIVGQNGTGKSTLIKICTEQIIPDSGRIGWQPNTTIGYLDQYAEIDHTLTMKEFLKSGKKEEMEGYNIDNEVIKYIATNIKSNIRELEGALTKIVALSRLNKCDITLALAEEALKDIISPNAEREVTPNLIIQVVSDHFGITPLDISSQKRTKEIVYPRQIVMYLCRNMTETPLQSIGRILGGRDHTTIIHGSEKIAADMNKDDNLKNTIEILKKKINPQ